MTNLEELTMKNKFSERLTDLELDIAKARAIVADLIQDYNLTDAKRMGEKLQYEASRVVTFLEIVFDYIIGVDNDIKTIQAELDTGELRKLCIASGELKKIPGEGL